MPGSTVTQSSADPFWKLAPHPNDVILRQLRLCRSLLFREMLELIFDYDIHCVVEGQMIAWLIIAALFGPAEDQAQHGRL